MTTVNLYLTIMDLPKEQKLTTVMTALDIGCASIGDTLTPAMMAEWRKTSAADKRAIIEYLRGKNEKCLN